MSVTHRMLLVAVLLAAACDGGARRPEPPVAVGRSAVLQVAGRSVQVELALDDYARSRGLMHRTRLEPDAGMLFVFPDEQPRTFWMHDTLIPLDIVFLESSGRVINVAHGEPGVERPGYHSARPARMVLELNGGWCETHGLRPGDELAVPPEILALGR